MLENYIKRWKANTQSMKRLDQFKQLEQANVLRLYMFVGVLLNPLSFLLAKMNRYSYNS